MKIAILPICLFTILSPLAMAAEEEQKPAPVLPQTPAQLDFYVNQAHNGRLGQGLSSYGLLLPDLPTVMPAVKAGFNKDMTARFAVLDKINEFVEQNVGKAPLVIIIGEMLSNAWLRLRISPPSFALNVYASFWFSNAMRFGIISGTIRLPIT
jgi:hypothetical protein